MRSQPTVSTLPLRKLILSNNLSLVLKVASTCWLVSISEGGALILLDYVFKKESKNLWMSLSIIQKKGLFLVKKKNSKFQQNRVLHPSVDKFLHLHREDYKTAKLQTVIAGGDTQDFVDCRLVTMIEAPQLQHREPPA